MKIQATKNPPFGRVLGIRSGSGCHRQSGPQFLHGVGFQLTDAFGRYLVFRGQLVQGRLVVVQPAALHDVPAARVQPLQRRIEPADGAIFPVLPLQRLRWIGLSRRQAA